MGKDISMTATRPPGGSVFLVEDEVMIRMMVADMLEELGYRVAAEAPLYIVAAPVTHVAATTANKPYRKDPSRPFRYSWTVLR